MAVIYSGKLGIFEAQHPPMLEGLYFLMKKNLLLIDRFLTLFYRCWFLWDNIAWIFKGVGSCGAALLEYLEVLVC